MKKDLPEPTRIAQALAGAFGWYNPMGDLKTSLRAFPCPECVGKPPRMTRCLACGGSRRILALPDSRLVYEP